MMLANMLFFCKIMPTPKILTDYRDDHNVHKTNWPTYRADMNLIKNICPNSPIKLNKPYEE